LNNKCRCPAIHPNIVLLSKKIVYYQNYKCIIRIEDFEILQGNIPTKQLQLALAWVEIHKDELISNWELCQNGEKAFQLIKNSPNAFPVSQHHGQQVS